MEGLNICMHDCKERQNYHRGTQNEKKQTDYKEMMLVLNEKLKVTSKTCIKNVTYGTPVLLASGLLPHYMSVLE